MARTVTRDTPPRQAGARPGGCRAGLEPSCPLAHPTPALSPRSLPGDPLLSEFIHLLPAPCPFQVPMATSGWGRGGRERGTQVCSEVQAARRWDLPVPNHWAASPADSGKGQTRPCVSPASPARGHCSLSPAPSTAREQKPHYLIPKVKVERPRLPGIRGGEVRGQRRERLGSSSSSSQDPETAATPEKPRPTPSPSPGARLVPRASATSSSARGPSLAAGLCPAPAGPGRGSLLELSRPSRSPCR